MTFPESFETARLVLRQAELADAGALFAEYTADPAVSRFLTWRPHRAARDCRAYAWCRDSAWAR